MKKIIKIFLVTMIAFFLSSNVKALKTSFTDDFEGFSINFSNDLNRIQIFSDDLIPGAPHNINTFFKLSSQMSSAEGTYAKGKILYCADGNKNSPSLESGEVRFDTNCHILKDTNSNYRSISYIYEHGYGTYKTNYSATEYLTGDKEKDYYITQAAMWRFTVAPSILDDFDFNAGTYKGQSNEVTKKISKLILDAESAAKGASLDVSLSKTKMKLTNDGKYYITDPIKIEGKFINSKITTTITGNSSAFATTNQDATSGTTNFDNNSTIYIKVPFEAISKDTTITLNASATTTIEESEIIECDHQQASAYNLQPVIIFYPKESTLTDKIAVTASVENYEVKISKKDINNSEEIEGATLTIKNSKNEVVSTWVSDKTTKSIKLFPGTYTLEETIAPEGYIKSTSKIEFTVDKNGKVLVGGKEVKEIIITNDPILVTISKRSIVGSKEIEGAKLKITDKDGNIAKDLSGNNLEWISGTKAKTFNLKAGDYILSETIAPKGYELSETTIEFTINSEGKVLVDGKEVSQNLIIFKNTPEPKQVPTGSTIIYIACSLCLVALGISIYIIFKRKKI